MRGGYRERTGGVGWCNFGEAAVRVGGRELEAVTQSGRGTGKRISAGEMKCQIFGVETLENKRRVGKGQ